MPNNTDYGMDIDVLKKAKKFFTVSLCYQEPVDINNHIRVGLSTEAKFKMTNTFVGTFNDPERSTVNFYSEFCDLSPLTKYIHQPDKKKLSTKITMSTLYSILVIDTELKAVPSVNFNSISISIADHEPSDSGIIHRLYPNIILSQRMVEKRLSVKDKYKIEELLLGLMHVIMEKFEFQYLQTTDGHVMSCRGSKYGYTIIPPGIVNMVGNNDVGEIESYSHCTLSKVLKELKEFASMQGVGRKKVVPKTLERYPHTTTDQVSRIKRAYDMNPYDRNRHTLENDQINHLIAVFKIEDKYLGLTNLMKNINHYLGNFKGLIEIDLDRFMKSTEFLRWVASLQPVVGIYNNGSQKISNMKKYSNTNRKIKKSVRFA